MTTRYFLAFPASDELKEAAEKVLQLQKDQAAESWVPYFDRLVSLFIPAFMENMLLNTCDAVGLSPRASKLIHSTAESLSNTISAMVAKLIKKRSNQELTPLADFVDDVYLRAENTSTGVDSVGSEIGQQHYEDILRVTQEVRNGNLEQVRDELTQVMLRTVDLITDNMMVRTINLLKVNFVLQKICDAAVATARGAGHLVVNKVFKNLDEESMLRLGDFFEKMLVIENR